MNREVEILQEYLETESRSLMVHLSKAVSILSDEDIDEGIKTLMLKSLKDKFDSFVKGFNVMFNLLNENDEKIPIGGSSDG